ncbi:MAG TPA: 2Fe-2S iron-sulfur cluster-binding protein [Bacteroidota bacterium]|nr:2Fe-2S iron-sulfur cluster-binding protein [Bacteroidota bacterium]
MPVITLLNEGKTIEAPAGANLRKTLLQNGVSPYRGLDKVLNCLGNGLCGTCRVEVVDGRGVSPMTPLEESALVGFFPLYGRQIPKNVRLACRATLTGDVSVRTRPVISIDWKLTRERMILSAIWTFFGLALTFVMVRLLIEIATGR